MADGKQRTATSATLVKNGKEKVNFTGQHLLRNGAGITDKVKQEPQPTIDGVTIDFPLIINKMQEENTSLSSNVSRELSGIVIPKAHDGDTKDIDFQGANNHLIQQSHSERHGIREEVDRKGNGHDLHVTVKQEPLDDDDTELNLSVIVQELQNRQEHVKGEMGLQRKDVKQEILESDETQIDLPSIIQQQLYCHNINGEKTEPSRAVIFVCQTCGKYFITSYDLKRHQRIHSEIKPYECQECGRRFTHSHHLRGHELTHSEVSPYECQQCGKCFKKSEYLRSHERTHSGEKPYECSQCSKCFSDSGNLRSHKKTHSGVKPYKCQKCGKCFTRTHHLRDHEAIHSGLKPYECLHCGKHFSWSRSLARHEQTHSRLKPCE